MFFQSLTFTTFTTLSGKAKKYMFCYTTTFTTFTTFHHKITAK